MAKPKKKISPALLVPGIVSVAIIALGIFSVVRAVDNNLYDVYLHLKPAIPESSTILLMDVDDTAISSLGQWPWPRNIMADGLITMKELGLGTAVFDIEYLEHSPPGIDRHYMENDLKTSFNRSFGELGSNFADLFSAIRNQQMTLRDAAPYVNELLAQTQTTGTELYRSSTKVARNNDLYLGQAMAFLENTFITLNRLEQPENAADSPLAKLAKQRFPVTIEGQEGRVPKYVDFKIPLEELVVRAKGAGLTNVQIDNDGKRRRIRLLENIGGKWYPQLVFAPLLQLLGNPKVILSSGELRLEGAHFPDDTTQNLAIPLDEDGMMLINWSPATFLGSFQHESFASLVNLNKDEDIVVARLFELAQRDIWKATDGSNVAQDLLTAHESLLPLKDAALESGKTADIQAWVEAKGAWRKALGEFIQPQSLVSLEQFADQQITGSKGTDKELWTTEKTQTKDVFSRLEVENKNYETLHATLTKKVAGKLAIIGYTGTGTSDIGVNPFHAQYVNVGTHSSLANTLLQKQFLSETPGWLSLLLVAPLAFGLIFILRNLKPLQQNLAGFGIVLGLLAMGVLFFLLTGIFVPLSGPLLAMFLSFVAYSLVRFFGSEQEKAFITKAFSTYLSPDVIDQIVLDPSKLKLGGEEKWMTAMFTDVKGFSTISEKLTASELVALLNEYLSGMSDIVLGEKGTIDKFEGDAIIAFYGAPLDIPDHASRACMSALRMRQLEETLNVHFLEAKMTPTALMTRIGINSGQMVVGNMGTTAKMNYTIMGSAVNLSARLEGVNKQYGTWILTTEDTAKDTGDTFLFRRLDSVRVVGINTPVLLQNLLGVRAELAPETFQMVERFHQGMDAFEGRDWKTANEFFTRLEKDFPEDGPSKLYAKRSAEYLAKPPAEDWDGVFNLTEK